MECFLRRRYTIQFLDPILGSNSWIQLSARDTRPNSLIQSSKNESSNWLKIVCKFYVKFSEVSRLLNICLTAWFHVVYYDRIGRMRRKKTNQFVFFSLDTIFFKGCRQSCKDFCGWFVVIWRVEKTNQSRYSMQIIIDYSTYVLWLLFAYSSIVICMKVRYFFRTGS